MANDLCVEGRAETFKGWAGEEDVRGELRVPVAAGARHLGAESPILVAREGLVQRRSKEEPLPRQEVGSA
jgi:hypothetical protein